MVKSSHAKLHSQQQVTSTSHAGRTSLLCVVLLLTTPSRATISPFEDKCKSYVKNNFTCETDIEAIYAKIERDAVRYSANHKQTELAKRMHTDMWLRFGFAPLRNGVPDNVSVPSTDILMLVPDDDGELHEVEVVSQDCDQLDSATCTVWMESGWETLPPTTCLKRLMAANDTDRVYSAARSCSTLRRGVAKKCTENYTLEDVCQNHEPRIAITGEDVPCYTYDIMFDPPGGEMLREARALCGKRGERRLDGDPFDETSWDWAIDAITWPVGNANVQDLYMHYHRHDGVYHSRDSVSLSAGNYRETGTWGTSERIGFRLNVRSTIEEHTVVSDLKGAGPSSHIVHVKGYMAGAFGTFAIPTGVYLGTCPTNFLGGMMIYGDGGPCFMDQNFRETVQEGTSGGGSNAWEPLASSRFLAAADPVSSIWEADVT